MFNLPWSKEGLYGTLFDKYNKKGSTYQISVLSESDPALHSYALSSKTVDNKGGEPIAILEEIRKNSTIQLRDYFINCNASSIEPVEDAYRQELDSLYSKCLIKNIYNEMRARGHNPEDFLGNIDSDPKQTVLGSMYEKCFKIAETTFYSSTLAQKYLSEGDYFNIAQRLKDYKEHVQNKLEDELKKVNCSETDNKINALLDFCEKAINMPYTDENTNINCKFTVDSKTLLSICENSFLKILEQKEFDNFELIKEYASREAYTSRKQLQIDLEKHYPQRLIIKQIFLPIPTQMLKVDDVYYAALFPLKQLNKVQYLYIGDSSKNGDEDGERFSHYDDYFQSYMNSQYCTEETKKRNRLEVIYNYTSNHAIIGQMPRDSFYGSENYKLVMWALIFDRKGRILIHRRANNAKDNQGLWDKSVGGHIAIKDRDTISGAAREIAEELYKVEEEEQSHSKSDSSWNTVRSDKIIYLGKWKETRYPDFGRNLNLEPDEFYLFSFESRMTQQPIDSGRILPNGTKIKARCFVELYFSITSENFDLNELKNSKYLVLPPELIKQCATTKQLTDEIREEIKKHNPNIDLNDISNHFYITPDLDYIISSPEWDSEITKFSLRVRDAFS